MHTNKLVEKDNNRRYLNKLKKEFVAKGITEKQFNEHIDKLGSLILIKAFGRLVELKPSDKLLEDERQLSDYVKTNFTDEEIYEILRQESKRIMGEYLEALKK